ncbi:MAG: M23 family metallopeptidase [Elusimicrobiota bacterium]|nr:M23 family metallopeptidase [Elusimicrobiota bacterium]
MKYSKLQKKFFVVVVIILLLILVLLNKSRILYFQPREPIIVLSSGTIQTGDVLFNVLQEHNLQVSEIVKALQVLNEKHSIRKIQPGDLYEVYHTTFGTINKLDYWVTPVEYFTVVKSTDNKFYCEKQIVPSKEIRTTVEGKINSTLYEAMIEKGISPEVIMKFADIFLWQVDFLTDVRVGDTFKFIYKQYKYENEVVKDGEILVAEYVGKQVNKNIAIYFKSLDGKISGYYTPEGKSLRKMFLRAPLSFRRISSHFSRKRFHPVLRYWRPHHGTDYVAPVGTPIESIGSGRVKFAGWKGGYGKVVIVRHNSTYSTLYAHLSRFAKKIRPGVRVNQGEVIGYLGGTGLCTGPHLHFEMHKYGKQVDFYKLKFPPARSIPQKYTEEFIKTKDELLRLLEEAL